MFCVVMDRRGSSSETRELVDLEKITTQIVGKCVLRGNGQVWIVIGDA